MKNHLKAIVIDDEKMARVLLESMLTEYFPDVKVVGVAADLPNGVKLIRKEKPDVVFLDIEMPAHSGLEILEFFNEDEINFSIIFTTAYNQYAIQAFKMSAVDYLLKPLEIADLEKALKRVSKTNSANNYQILRENLSSKHSKKIIISTTNALKYVEIDSICHLKADGAYTEIFMADGSKIITSKNLKHFEGSLVLFNQFFRCHKSYIINFNFVQEYIKSDGGGILTKNNHFIPISNDKSGDFFEQMALYM